MSELAKDVTQSVKDNIASKRKSPLYAAFLLAWVAYNWQAILTLFFFKGDIKSRLEAVVQGASLENQLFYPFLWAVGFLIVVPYINSLYSYYVDPWYGSFHDSSGVRREIFNSNKRIKLEKKKAILENQGSISKADIDKKIADKELEAAKVLLEARLIHENIESIDKLKEDLLESERKLSEAINSKNLADANVKMLEETGRGSYLSRLEVTAKANQLRNAIRDGHDPDSLDKYIFDLARMNGVSESHIANAFKNPQEPS